MHSGNPALRVLHVITRLDAGGAATNTLVTAARQRQLGLDAQIAYGVTRDPDGRVAQRLAADGVAAHFLPHLIRNVQPWHDILARREIGRLLDRVRFDLVHTHTSKAGALGRHAAFARGLPVIHTPHGHIFYGYFGRPAAAVFAAIERRLARRTRYLVSLTPDETVESLARSIGVPGQYVTIPSGVPLRDFLAPDPAAGASFRAHWAVPADAPLAVTAGRLTAIKGMDTALRALAAARRSESRLVLAVAGEGEERRALEALAAELDLGPHVRFTGHLEDLRPALAAADVFLLASRNEGMGRVMVEALAAGVPAIGTRVGGIPTLLRDGDNGLLVPADDPEALAAALVRLLRDEPLRRTLRARGPASVFPAYDESSMIEQLTALSRRAVAEHRQGLAIGASS